MKFFVPLHNLHTEKVHTVISNLFQLWCQAKWEIWRSKDFRQGRWLSTLSIKELANHASITQISKRRKKTQVMRWTSSCSRRAGQGWAQEQGSMGQQHSRARRETAPARGWGWGWGKEKGPSQVRGGQKEPRPIQVLILLRLCINSII